MQSGITDVERTLEFAQSHTLARKALPWTLFGILVGLFMLTPIDSAEAKRENVLLGSLILAISLAFLGVVIYRRAQPSEPSIVLSSQGVLFRDLSEKIIPWNEVIEVGETRVSAPRDFLSTRVTRLVVSQRFLRSMTGSIWLNGVIATDGDPSEIYLSYFHAVPVDELQAALRARWQAFSRHAAGKGAWKSNPAAAERLRADLPEATELRGTGVVQRARSFEGGRALGSLVREASLGERAVTIAAIAGIVLLLANQLGLWSTAAQVRARAAAAEHRAWKERYDAERKETEAAQQRLRERMDRAFRCMEMPQRGASYADCVKDGR